MLSFALPRIFASSIDGQLRANLNIFTTVGYKCSETSMNYQKLFKQMVSFSSVVGPAPGKKVKEIIANSFRGRQMNSLNWEGRLSFSFSLEFSYH